jgi:hypothetical protein
MRSPQRACDFRGLGLLAGVLIALAVAGATGGGPARATEPADDYAPLAVYTIAGLRLRAYPGGALEITHVVTATETFTKYLIRSSLGPYSSQVATVSPTLCL